MKMITRHCAYPGCEKTWKTVEESKNYFHNESHRKLAERQPEGSIPQLLAFEQLEAMGKIPGDKRNHVNVAQRKTAEGERNRKLFRMFDDFVADKSEHLD